MKGAIIGDVVGSVYEYNNTFDYNFPLLTEESIFTDDTICTVAIADALLNKKNYAVTLKEWCRNYPHPKGDYGLLFNQWIWNDDLNFTNDSCGNGALMRVSPIALYRPLSTPLVYKNGHDATVCSHKHPESISAVIVYLRIIRNLLKTKDKKNVNTIMADAYTSQWNKALPEQGTFVDTCADSLKIVSHLFMESESFEDAIRLAVIYGGDSDTIGAIMGGMAEAYYGVDNLLWNEVEKRLPEPFRVIIHHFYKGN